MESTTSVPTPVSTGRPSEYTTIRITKELRDRLDPFVEKLPNGTVTSVSCLILDKTLDLLETTKIESIPDLFRLLKDNLPGIEARVEATETP